ncbi:hypothetical protein E2C01_078208 [Portunus trituberculatus]|uniref:Uncharacterized protein n=1 Tax=Portunus trituberculatus TaxID=210409 RepID=A0A5B7IPG6_PORTR|nr:hypothetical protein [Portunus trituberculatus]
MNAKHLILNSFTINLWFLSLKPSRRINQIFSPPVFPAHLPRPGKHALIRQVNAMTGCRHAFHLTQKFGQIVSQIWQDSSVAAPSGGIGNRAARLMVVTLSVTREAGREAGGGETEAD